MLTDHEIEKAVFSGEANAGVDQGAANDLEKGFNLVKARWPDVFSFERVDSKDGSTRITSKFNNAAGGVVQKGVVDISETGEIKLNGRAPMSAPQDELVAELISITAEAAARYAQLQTKPKPVTIKALGK